MSRYCHPARRVRPMRSARLLVFLLALPLALPAARAADDADDWKLIGGVLALVQQIVHLQANSADPKAAQQGVDEMLAGRNPQANRVAGELINEIMVEVPTEHRN